MRCPAEVPPNSPDPGRSRHPEAGYEGPVPPRASPSGGASGRCRQAGGGRAEPPRGGEGRGGRGGARAAGGRSAHGGASLLHCRAAIFSHLRAAGRRPARGGTATAARPPPPPHAAPRAPPSRPRKAAAPERGELRTATPHTCVCSRRRRHGTALPAPGCTVPAARRRTASRRPVGGCRWAPRSPAGKVSLPQPPPEKAPRRGRHPRGTRSALPAVPGPPAGGAAAPPRGPPPPPPAAPDSSAGGGRS